MRRPSHSLLAVLTLGAGVLAGPTTSPSADTPEAAMKTIIAAAKANDLNAALPLFWKSDVPAKRARVEAMVRAVSGGEVDFRFLKATTQDDIAVVVIEVTEKGQPPKPETGGMVRTDTGWRVVFDAKNDGLPPAQADRLTRMLDQSRQATSRPATAPDAKSLKQ